MRAVLVTTSWPANEHDPAGHFVRAHARALERQGHAVVVFAPEPGGAFGWPGVVTRLAERPERVVEAAWWTWRTRRAMAAVEADLVVAHWAVPCGYPIAVAARCPVDLVSHGQDVRLLRGLPGAMKAWVTSNLLRKARTWTFASAALLEDLLAASSPNLRRGIERIALVAAPPIEMPEITAAVAELRRALGERRVGVAVGRLVRAKRVDLAVAHVARSSELDCLVVVGDGPERGRLERLAADLRVDVRFVGAVERPLALAWIGAADALIHSSRAEGLSTVIREAEALGTRVVRLGYGGAND